MKFFKSHEGYYIYDPPSNILAKVKEPVYKILKAEWEGNLSHKIKELEARYGREEVQKALLEIKTTREKFNAFKIKYPYFSKLEFPYSKTQIEETLRNRVSYLVLELTESCNLRCKYCKYSGSYKGERSHGWRSMSKGTILNSLKFLKKHSQESKKIIISFYGGEPLLRFDLIRFTVEKAEKLFDKKLFFYFTTNGTLLNERIIDFLVKHNFYIKVSIDGPKYLHDRYRVDVKGRETFERIAKNLSVFKNKYPDFYDKNVGLIITLAPPFYLNEVIEFFESWHLTPKGSSRLITVDEVDTDFYDKFYTPENKRKFQKEFEELKRWVLSHVEEKDNLRLILGWHPVFQRILQFHERSAGIGTDILYINGFCIPGNTKLFIDVDGNFYPCEKIPGHFKIGDLENGFDFEKIHRVNEKILKLREKLPCKTCWAGRICQMCYARIIRNEVIREDLMRKLCEVEKKKAEEIIKDYIYLLENKPDFLYHLKTYTTKEEME